VALSDEEYLCQAEDRIHLWAVVYGNYPSGLIEDGEFLEYQGDHQHVENDCTHWCLPGMLTSP